MLWGVVGAGGNVLVISARQRLIPAKLLGRVNSAYRLVGMGGMPLGAAAGGVVAEFAGLARSIAADRGQWAHLVQYDATARWYHRLRTGPGYEVWLLSWLPGQGSGPHDHGASSGVLTVLEGELTEHTSRGRLTHRPGSQRVLAPGFAHEVVHEDAVIRSIGAAAAGGHTAGSRHSLFRHRHQGLRRDCSRSA